ncbi:MAG: serine/threonine-protein kinase, partial [Isosphaeraceae bacterium]
GVISSRKLAKYLPPKGHPKDAQELARELVRQKHLTKFQAQEIYQGRVKSLILGNYTILDRIGAGGMGQVFKAEHRRMKRVVALKMLPKNVMKDAAAVARFQREVVAAARLSHTNIVAAYDADEANGVHFLVMEYVEGSDLSALVKKHGPLPATQAVNCVLQAARGLEFAHAEGVVHRDVKPSNLLLDKKGVVKILDMGLARIESGGAAQAELTGTGAVLGTIDYMAPEQALSTKDADARADIYSLGCSLYYLVAGRAIYGGDTLMAKLLAHRESPIPSLGAGVPEPVTAVFRKMVAKDIEDRYQTMSQVVADLEKCGSGQPEPASIQHPADTDFDNDALTFLRDIPALATQKPHPKPAGPLSLRERVRVRRWWSRSISRVQRCRC